MEQHEVSFTFKGRYYKIGQINSQTKQIWFVLHGYGQLAKYFIKKFETLAERNICVIAPEGLSTFYLEPLQPGAGRANNRVGATWMTRENRLLDIDNYVEYLNEVYKREVNAQNIKVTILGFSQGSATASRWVLSGKIKFDRLILWAGIFPPDMDFENGKDLLKQKEVFMIYGKQDPFLTDASAGEMKMLVEKLSINVKEMTFEGEHEIHAPTLISLI
jgi:predicted esterase